MLPGIVVRPVPRPVPRFALAAVAFLAAPVAGQSGTSVPVPPAPAAERAALAVEVDVPVADPKLAGGGVAMTVTVTGAAALPVAVEIEGPGGGVLATPFAGTVSSGAAQAVLWDGRSDAGAWLDVGAYSVRASAPGAVPATATLHLVRLGITEIEARESASGGDEWQMVYFKKGPSYAFFATPAVHEYLCVADDGEVSDLDLDDGSPRPPVSVHDATDSPVLEGGLYEDDSYNYPLCYLAGAAPRLAVTFGASATSASGAATGAGYPVPGLDLRAVARIEDQLVAATGPIQPGGEAVIELPPLPAEPGRTDLAVRFAWQARAAGAVAGEPWAELAGELEIPLRFYTLIGPPVFAASASGTQYAGPWVEVAEHWSAWKDAVGIPGRSPAGFVETMVKGFFGQNSGLGGAIEGVIYDAYPLGGDGGATHYFSFGTWTMDLSALLNGHAKGVYVNCSDCMGATSTMLAMMGVRNVRPMRLGPMTLKAIWGIGAPAYTTNLWGFSHGFSYHHVVTRDEGTSVIDTCMQLDEDGTPETVPGVPGWNHDRPWADPGGYDDLSSYNLVSKTLESLPGLK